MDEVICDAFIYKNLFIYFQILKPNFLVQRLLCIFIHQNIYYTIAHKILCIKNITSTQFMMYDLEQKNLISF